MSISGGRIYTQSIGGHNVRTITLTESTSGRRVNELYNKLIKEDPDVFVSHKNEDQYAAEIVAETIAKSGLKVYLDVWDSNIDDGPELVDYIKSIIECCESLIAVVSHNTVNSWWVPLEIGIAITEDLYLGTYLAETYKKSKFPSYLWKWPVLVDRIDVERWCREREKVSSPERLYESLNRSYSYMFRQ